MKNMLLALSLMMVPTMLAQAQDRPVRWRRGEPGAQIPLTVFHSTQSVHLPTAETMQQGELQFEIWHRFLPPISSGVNGLWGLDGPVNVRFGLGYALTDEFVFTLGRSNVQDNVDLQFKYRALEIPSENLPFLIGFQAGVGWNTDVAGRKDSDSRNFQYYGQIIINTIIDRRLAVGLVPSYLNNIDVSSAERENEVSLGLYSHYYASELLGLLAEWHISESNVSAPFNALTLGVQLETGGHFFKVFVTNSASLNPSLFLAGAVSPFDSDDIRLGFNITRLLK